MIQKMKIKPLDLKNRSDDADGFSHNYSTFYDNYDTGTVSLSITDVHYMSDYIYNLTLDKAIHKANIHNKWMIRKALNTIKNDWIIE